MILILAAGLRLTGLTFDSLWLDESYQTVVEAYGNNLPDLFNAKGRPFLYKPDSPASLQTVLDNFRKVDPLCPPLYATVINRWLTIFGGSDFALRGFSVLCSLLAVSATYFVAYLLLGRNTALYAALLQTISPFDIAYAQEARMYSLCTLGAVLSGGSFLYFIKSSMSAHVPGGEPVGADFVPPAVAPTVVLLAIIYIISTWALVNSHYTQLFIWFFAILAGFVLSMIRKSPSILAWTLITNLGVFILCLPWLSFFVQAANMHTASFYIARQASIFWPIWALFCRIPFNWLIFLIGKKVMFWAVPGYLTAACLVGYLLFILIKKYRAAGLAILSKPVDLILTLLLFWALIPALTIWTLDVFESHRVIEIPRYLIGTAPAIYLLAGYAISLLEKTRYCLTLAIMHACFCLANNAYMHIVPQREGWRSVAQFVEKACSPDEPILVSHYYNIVCLDRYLDSPLRQIGVSPSFGRRRIEYILKDILDSDRRPNSISSNIKPFRHTFWVLSGQDGDTIFNIIPDRFKAVHNYDFPHAVHLRQYQEWQP